METKDFEEDFEIIHQRLKHKIFSAMAHDLKTPLTCIIGSLQMISQMSEYLSSEQHDVLIKTALMEAERLNELFNKTLEQMQP